MSDENVQLVRAALAAFFAGDLDRALAHVDADAITYRVPPMPDPQEYRGPDGVLEAYADWTADFGEFDMSMGEAIDAGDRVAIEILQRGTGRASGAAVEGRFWFVYTIADGKVVRQDIFNGKRQALEAAGLRAPRADGVETLVGEVESITARERRDVVLLADHEDVSITWSRYATGERGPDPHVHREHTDSFYVLEGELTFALGPDAKPLRVTAGGFVAVPPNLIHSFACDGAEARFLNFHTPDGDFAAFMRGRRDGVDTPFDSFDPPADGGLAAAEAVVSGPGEGERLVSGNRTALLKCAVADLSLAEWTLDGPIAGPRPHHHDDQVDSFYVLEGELEMTIEDTVEAVGAGTLAAVPRGVHHTFAYAGAAARFLNIHAPDERFAEFLRQISD